MGGLVEAVEQGESVGGAGGVAVQEGGGGAEGGVVAAVEDLAQVEGEEAALGPLHAVAEDDLAEGEEEHPAGRLVEAVNVLAEDVFPGVWEDFSFQFGVFRKSPESGCSGELRIFFLWIASILCL